MGKATILENLGEGQYRINEEVDFSNVEARRAQLASKEIELQSARQEAIVELNQQSAIKDAFQIAIDDYVAANPGKPIDENLRGLIKAQQEAAFNEGSARINLSRIDADIFATEREIKILDDALESLDIDSPVIPKPFKREKIAWCADYTTDLTGDVGIIDTNRKVNLGTAIIQPGESPRVATYDIARDGKIQPALAASPYGVFWNAAQLPGAGVWRARHATGALTDVDKVNDTATVSMDERSYRFLTVSIGGLYPNKQQTISNVPIEYSVCNSTVFEAGDRVVVEFDANGVNPKVIGFEANPVQCTAGFALQRNFFIFDQPDGFGSGISIPADLYTIIPKEFAPGGTYPHSAILETQQSQEVFDFREVPFGATGPIYGWYEQPNGLLYRVTTSAFENPPDLVDNPSRTNYLYWIASSIRYVAQAQSRTNQEDIQTDQGIIDDAQIAVYSNESWQTGPAPYPNIHFIAKGFIGGLVGWRTFSSFDLPLVGASATYYKAPSNNSSSYMKVFHPDTTAVSFEILTDLSTGGIGDFPANLLFAYTPYNTYGTLPLLDVSEKFSIIG